MAGVEGFELVFELVQLLGWPVKFAHGAKRQYLRWLELKTWAKDFRSSRLAPSATVATVWDVHRQWSLDYMATCEGLGGYVHHFPLAMRDEAAKEVAYARTVDAYKTLFGEDPPALFWEPFGAHSNGASASAAAATGSLSPADDDQGNEPISSFNRNQSTLPNVQDQGHNGCASRQHVHSLGIGPFISQKQQSTTGSGTRGGQVIGTAAEKNESGLPCGPSYSIFPKPDQRLQHGHGYADQRPMVDSADNQQQSARHASGVQLTAAGRDTTLEKQESLQQGRVHHRGMPMSHNQQANSLQQSSAPRTSLQQAEVHQGTSDLATLDLPNEQNVNAQQSVLRSAEIPGHDLQHSKLAENTSLPDEGADGSASEPASFASIPARRGRGRPRKDQVASARNIESMHVSAQVSSQPPLQVQSHPQSYHRLEIESQSQGPMLSESDPRGNIQDGHRRGSESAAVVQQTESLGILGSSRSNSETLSQPKSTGHAFQADGIVKRKVGRPRKDPNALPKSHAQSAEKAARMEGLVLRPLVSGEKRGRGRPRLSDYVKLDDLPAEEREKVVRRMEAEAAAMTVGAQNLTSGGSSLQASSQTQAGNHDGTVEGGEIAASIPVSNPLIVKRGRGRPRKDGHWPIPRSVRESNSNPQLLSDAGSTSGRPAPPDSDMVLNPSTNKNDVTASDENPDDTVRPSSVDHDTIDAAQLSDWAAGGDHPPAISIDHVVSQVQPAKHDQGRPAGPVGTEKKVLQQPQVSELP
jgi:hypothetical protein